jgi:hypothetical protein
MMRRIFWTALGVGFGASAGILVARRIKRTTEALAPTELGGALAGAISGLADSVREFAGEVRAGMAEREDELITALGIDAPDGE